MLRRKRSLPFYFESQYIPKNPRTTDLFYDKGALMIYGMLRGQTDKHLTRKN
jgi:hypothetical protein